MRNFNPNHSVMLVLFLSFFGITLVQALSPQSNTASNIEINHPAHESSVDQFGESIQFRSNSAISNSYVPVVFIKDPISQWWPWLQSRSGDKNRMNWRLNNVQFGVGAERGLEFQIQVIVIPRGDIENGIVLQEGRRMFIEAGSPIKNSVFVTVLKERYPTQSNVVVVTRN